MVKIIRQGKPYSNSSFVIKSSNYKKTIQITKDNIYVAVEIYA